MIFLFNSQILRYISYHLLSGIPSVFKLVTRSHPMGAQCVSKPEETDLPKVVNLKIMTLDYGKTIYTPMEVFTYGSEYNLWEINKIFAEMGEKEFQQIEEEDDQSLFGPIQKDFRKGRYSPLYFKMAGVQTKKGKGQQKEYYAESEQKFFENWDKRFNNFKNSKTMKQKYSEIDQKKLKRYAQILKRFDLLVFKCMLKYVINMTYKECVDNKVNLTKYLRAVESDFNFKYLEEDKKSSIFSFELSKLYPTFFLVQNHSPKLVNKLKKEAHSCFKFYANADQLIIINKEFLENEEFQEVDIKKQAKNLQLDMDKSEASLSQPSNRASLQNKQESELKNIAEEQSEEGSEAVQPWTKMFAICSQHFFVMSVNFSSDYSINEDQVNFLGYFLEAIQNDKNRKFSEKVILVGGILNNEFPNINGYSYYPQSEEDITYYKRVLPLCLEVINGDDSSIQSEMAEAANKIITNREIIDQTITLIDGKTSVKKRTKNTDDQFNDSDQEDEVQAPAKQFQSYEQEEDYKFNKLANEQTIIPCEIHPFESYLVQAEISLTNKVKVDAQSSADRSVGNPSMGI